MGHFSSTRLFALWFITVGFISITSCVTSISVNTNVNVNPGRVYGNIIFENTSVEIAAHLASNNVVDHPLTDTGLEPVRLTNPSTRDLQASSYYTSVNTAPDASTYIAASYDMNPNVEDTGSDFLAWVQNIKFSDGASYVMGSPNNLSTYANMCTGVMPITTNPSGTQCHISECAGLIKVKFRLTGSTDDLNAIDTNVPAECTIFIYVEDPSGSGTLNLQALKSSTYPINDLLSGEMEPLLVRATPDPIQIEIRCSVQILPGEEGFVVIPETGLTPIKATHTVSSLSCGQTVGGDTSPPIDIIVQRNAGKLQGYFDVSGYDEVDGKSRIFIDTLYSGFFVQPVAVPSSSIPSEKWIFEGLTPGIHRVMACALIDGGNQQLIFPMRDGPNLPVYIFPGLTTDIGTTFVSKPVQANGTVRLFDKTGLTGLDTIRSQPFSDSASYWSYFTSFMEAKGDPAIPSIGTNPGSGIGGESRGRLIGSYNTTTHEAIMNYQLLLNGISPNTGSLDGTNAKPTLWDVEVLNVTFGSNGADSESRITLGHDLHYLADPNLSEDIQIPELQICFGYMGCTLRIDPGVGTLFFPEMYFSEVFPFSSTITGSSYYSSVRGKAEGIPNWFGDYATEVHVGATVPQGYQYSTHIGVYLAPAGATDVTEATYVRLNEMALPSMGVVKCGSLSWECVDVLDEQGNSTILSVNILDASGVGVPLYCVTEDSVDLSIHVNSDGTEVTSLVYLVDPVLDPSLEIREAVRQACVTAPTGEVCMLCGPDPVRTIGITALAPGPHSIYVGATSSSGCFAFDNYSFEVMDVDFTIQCSPDFTVVLNPGETEIPSNDPRITASLSASIVGDCGTSVEISDNRPDTFQCGTTTPVQFTASGIGNCTTQVTVECTPRHYLAYVEKIFPTISAIKVHHVEEDISTMYDSFGVLQPHQIWVEYDRTGNLLGYVRGEGSQSVKVLNTLTGMSAFPMFAVPAIPVNMAFRPGSIDQHVVVTTMDYQSYEIQLVEASSITSSQTIPSTAGMARPEIAWSPTGDKLSVIYAVRQAGNVNLYIYRWDVVGNVFSNQTLTSVTWPLQLVTKELIHLGDGNLFFGTSFTINYVSGSNINTLYMDSIHDIDFTDDGKAAAYLRKYDLAPGEPVMLVGLIDLDQLGASRLINGPVFVKGRSVALSSDREYVAVGTDEEIFIYTFPDFTLVRRFPANLPHDLVFCSPAFIP